MRSLKKATVAWLHLALIPDTHRSTTEKKHGRYNLQTKEQYDSLQLACNTNTHKPQLNIWTVSQKRFTKRVYFSLRFAKTLP